MGITRHDTEITDYRRMTISRYVLRTRYNCWVKYYLLSFYRYRGVANPWFISVCVVNDLNSNPKVKYFQVLDTINTYIFVQ